MKIKIFSVTFLVASSLALACVNTTGEKSGVKCDSVCGEAVESVDSVAVAAEPKSPYYMSGAEYTSEDSIMVERLLREAVSERSDEHPMLYFGKKFLGVPYVAHTLENGDSEHLIVNLREMDCTTFVETVTALTLCHRLGLTTFEDYCGQLVKVRYREGKMGDYTSRLHYFTWWGEDNERLGIVKCVFTASKPFTAVQTLDINYMSKHPQSYKQLKAHPEFVDVIRSYERGYSGKTYRYIPKSEVGGRQSGKLGIVETGDIIAMLTSKEGLDTSHIGIAVWQDGRLHLLNASYVYKKVVLDKHTFYDYQQRQTSQTGIRVFRVVEGL